MQCITDPEQVESTAIRKLFEYWRSKCAGRDMPRRADIDPVEIPTLMPNLLVADIEYDPFRVRYRLVGTRVVEMTGYEFTGRYLDEIALPNDEGPFQECYQLACESRSPVMSRIKWHLAPNTTEEYDICILPLSDDGRRVNMALAIECYATVKRDYIFHPGRRDVPGSKAPGR
jgi:hypothetical protein